MHESLLAHERIKGEKAPSQWIFVLHGFLGSGRNWRSFARNLVKAKPVLGAVLVDLRLHGHSKSFHGPHSIEAAAQDIAALRASFTEPVTAILGHSFGGKVALNYVRLADPALKQAFLIDFKPWSSEDKKSASSTYKILALIKSLATEHFVSREAFIARLEQGGLLRSTAEWLSMNGDTSDEGFSLRIDPRGLQDLLDDYFALDLMPMLNAPLSTHLTFILGEQSLLLTEDDRWRLIDCAKKNPQQINTTVLAGAGHDVHMDRPDELLSLITATFLD